MHAVFIEDVLRLVVKLYSFFRARGNLGHQFLHALDRSEVVADDGIDFLGEKIAHRALDKTGFLEQLVRSALRLHAPLDLVPLVEQEGEVADEEARTLPRADGADDDAHAFGNFQFVEDLAQALALLRVVDLARDAALRAVRHED